MIRSVCTTSNANHLMDWLCIYHWWFKLVRTCSETIVSLDQKTESSSGLPPLYYFLSAFTNKIKICQWDRHACFIDGSRCLAVRSTSHSLNVNELNNTKIPSYTSKNGDHQKVSVLACMAVAQKKELCCVVGNVNQYSCYWKSVWDFAKK